MTWLQRIARARIHLGIVSAALAYWLARPTMETIAWGALVALPGEAIRVWASGHLQKEREVTRSGPYRFVRHPLYLGSAIIGLGFAVAAWSVWSALVVALYLGVTLAAAIRTEEGRLLDRYGGEYADYREGRAAPVARPFSVAQVMANREYRALLGFAAALALLWVRMRLL